MPPLSQAFGVEILSHPSGGWVDYWQIGLMPTASSWFPSHQLLPARQDKDTPNSDGRIVRKKDGIGQLRECGHPRLLSRPLDKGSAERAAFVAEQLADSVSGTDGPAVLAR